MWRSIKAKLEQMSSHYPPRWWWPVIRIYGGLHARIAGACYMTRIIIIPTINKVGALYLHIFHREDQDRDPHDHPFPFWTFPLWQGYYEEVYVHDLDERYGVSFGCVREVYVPAWRWTKREATHTHRVTRTASGRWPLVTLVWRGTSEQKWGFWTHIQGARGPLAAARTKTPWRDYVDDGVDANLDGLDPTCPGVPRDRFHNPQPGDRETVARVDRPGNNSHDYQD